MTVADACDADLRDQKARNLRKPTTAAYKSLFGQLRAHAAENGIETLSEFDRPALRKWREAWTCAASTAGQRLVKLKAFFAHAVVEGWIAESPAAGVRAPKNDSPPTLPLSLDEMRALLRASEGSPKERALILLMRYAGLAIGDASRLRRDRVGPGGELTLRRTKSGELVTVALPLLATAALEGIAAPRAEYFFWTGRSHPETPPKYWRKRLAQVARNAGIEGFHPHRLRDTFAVELLAAGVLMQDVSALLGHSSVATTEKYYAAWNKARRNRLLAVSREAHRQDPLLSDLTPMKPAGSVAADPAGASLTTRQTSKQAGRSQGSRYG